MTLHIPDFSSAHVLVAGDVMLDQYSLSAHSVLLSDYGIAKIRGE